VGLTEQTDALVIIISEQSGVISLADNGSLSPVDIKELHRKLEAEFTHKLKGKQNV
jgi:diadenylate cyclase